MLILKGVIEEKYGEVLPLLNQQLTLADQMLQKYKGSHTTGKDVRDMIDTLSFYRENNS